MLSSSVWVYVWTATSLIHPVSGITCSAIPITLGWEFLLLSGVKRRWLQHRGEASYFTVRNHFSFFFNLWGVLLFFQIHLWISTPWRYLSELLPSIQLFGDHWSVLSEDLACLKAIFIFQFSCPLPSLWRVRAVTQWSSLDDEISGFSIGLFPAARGEMGGWYPVATLRRWKSKALHSAFASRVGMGSHVFCSFGGGSAAID